MDFAPKLAGGVANMIGAPVLAAARPAARALNNAMDRLNLAPHEFTWDPRNPYRKLEGEEAQRAVEGDLVTAASSVQSPLARALPKPKAIPVDELRAAKTAAYKAVDDMGITYRPEATTDLYRAIRDEAASSNISPTRHPKAWSMIKDIEARLDSGFPVAMTKLDQLRQEVWRDVAAPTHGDAEAFFGKKMLKNIDEFVDAAGPRQVMNGDAPRAAEAIRTARELNARYKKTQTVENEVQSAKGRAASTYAGGNQANAIRQELRPLIDPTSGQRIHNLTPAEHKALKKVVYGTGAANAWRTTGKLLDPRGLIGAAVQGAGFAKTGGLSTASIPLGVLASAMSNRATMKSVQELLRLLSAAPKPKGPPIARAAGQAPLKLLSGPGLVGAVSSTAQTGEGGRKVGLIGRQKARR